MANINGQDISKIKIVNGSDTTSHNLKDASARLTIADLEDKSMSYKGDLSELSVTTLSTLLDTGYYTCLATYAVNLTDLPSELVGGSMYLFLKVWENAYKNPSKIYTRQDLFDKNGNSWMRIIANNYIGDWIKINDSTLRSDLLTEISGVSADVSGVSADVSSLEDKSMSYKGDLSELSVTTLSTLLDTGYYTCLATYAVNLTDLPSELVGGSMYLFLKVWENAYKNPSKIYTRQDLFDKNGNSWMRIIANNYIGDWIKTQIAYKVRSGNYEWFTVNVSRPLAYGGEEMQTATETIEAVLRLPQSYDPYGKPTRLIFMAHGSHGKITASSSEWYNNNWKTFCDALLDAGYALFDTNTFSSGDNKGYGWGSALYINVVKAAYDYIMSNYNVHKQIFVHGTSMGGVGANAFAHVYPGLVLAESSFAGASILRVIRRLYNTNHGLTPDLSSDDDPQGALYAAAFGYASVAEMNADKFSHIAGFAPELSLVKINSDGTIDVPPDRETQYDDWLAYYARIDGYGQNDNAGTWMGKRSVPCKAWHSKADTTVPPKTAEILAKAYQMGNACPYYAVTYDSGTHTQLSYGQINDMIQKLIQWYRRWE